MNLTADQSFDKSFVFRTGEYDNCIFDYCDFSGNDLSGSTFVECRFNGCNFSMATVSKTSFQDVVFKDCKLLGFRFDRCNSMMFSAQFDTCQLDLSSFYRMKLRKQKFIGCSMREVDFSETDLAHALFSGCDLHKAIFENTLLEKADLRSASNFSIDPENNYLRGAKFVLSGIPGLLHKYGLEIDI